MKDKILKLRACGYTYKQICETLGCAKSTVGYYCGINQKEKTAARTRAYRMANVLTHRVENFQAKPTGKAKRPPAKSNVETQLRTKADDFQRRVGNKLKERNIRFRCQDVLKKFGNRTCCYLTGKAIDLSQPGTYHFDHIVPATRGGDNSLANLGIATREANQAKADLTVSELLQLCEDILAHHGYTVKPQRRM